MFIHTAFKNRAKKSFAKFFNYANKLTFAFPKKGVVLKK
jgi:hypothetical protein